MYTLKYIWKAMNNENEFIIIPFADKYLINQKGIIKNKEGREIKPYFSKHTKRLMVKLCYNNGNFNDVSLAYLLGKVFISLPSNLTYETATLIHKDENYLNYSLCNLEWKDKQYTRSLLEKRKRLDIRKKYNVPNYIPQNEYLYPNAIECEQMKGFYYLPFCDHPIVISKEGKVFNLETKEYITFYDNEYIILNLRIKDKNTTTYLHRLLTQLFIQIPFRHLDKEIDDLEANHIDGNKHNYALDNLEWVTRAENMEHAYLNDLLKYSKVEARHILNNRKYTFYNITDCAERFNLNRLRLSRHLKSKKAGTITKNWFVFKYLDESIPWPKLTEKQTQKDTWDILYKIWYAKNKDTEETIIHSTLDELCGVLNLPINLVKCHLNDHRKDTPYDDWVIWSDDTPLEEVAKDKQRKPPEGIRPAINIKFTSNLDGSVLIFDSATKAGKYFNVDSKTFKYAIEHKNSKFKQYIVELIN